MKNSDGWIELDLRADGLVWGLFLSNCRVYLGNRSLGEFPIGTDGAKAAFVGAAAL